MSPPKDPEKRKIYCENAIKRSKKLWEDAELVKKMCAGMSEGWRIKKEQRPEEMKELRKIMSDSAKKRCLDSKNNNDANKRSILWTLQEEKYLLENYIQNTPSLTIQSVLNRHSYGSIKDKARRMGLKGRKKYRNNAKFYTSPIDGKIYSIQFSHAGYLKTIIDGKECKIHRIEMEKLLGRKLKPYEGVHHKNGIKTDNSPENLMLFDQSKRHAHIDTDRAESAEQFIKEKGLWDEFVRRSKT